MAAQQVIPGPLKWYNVSLRTFNHNWIREKKIEIFSIRNGKRHSMNFAEKHHGKIKITRTLTHMLFIGKRA
tara:strand:+ start:221 stop:433 length:213 start_codon:yes stop_codon:yes gene_type:complete